MISNERRLAPGQSFATRYIYEPILLVFFWINSWIIILPNTTAKHVQRSVIDFWHVIQQVTISDDFLRGPDENFFLRGPDENFLRGPDENLFLSQSVDSMKNLLFSLPYDSTPHVVSLSGCLLVWSLYFTFFFSLILRLLPEKIKWTQIWPIHTWLEQLCICPFIFRAKKNVMS